MSEGRKVYRMVEEDNYTSRHWKEEAWRVERGFTIEPGVWYPLDADPARRVEELEAERDEAREQVIAAEAEATELALRVEGLEGAALPVLGWLDTLASRIIGEGGAVPARRERDAEILRALLREGGEDAE